MDIYIDSLFSYITWICIKYCCIIKKIIFLNDIRYTFSSARNLLKVHRNTIDLSLRPLFCYTCNLLLNLWIILPTTTFTHLDQYWVYSQQKIFINQISNLNTRRNPPNGVFQLFFIKLNF